MRPGGWKARAAPPLVGIAGLLGLLASGLAWQPPPASTAAPEEATRPAGQEAGETAPAAGEPGSGAASELQPIEAAAFAPIDAPGTELPALFADALPARPDPVYRVEIDAAYDPSTYRIEGVERLTWRNPTGTPAESLCFHHYLNAFASSESTFMHESGGQLRGDTFDEKRWGWIEVGSLLARGEDLAPRGRYVAPDDGNPEDRTVALYPLAEPVAPGEEIELEIAFTSRLPTIFARTGAAGDYVLAGQWFPKIAVFEGADAGGGGTVEGWNCHQFHAHSEFFADFGDWRVTLTLPERYRGKIGATGRLVEEAVDAEEGTVTVRFEQAGVHDFAWTADPDFLVREATFDPERDVPPEWRREVAALLGLEPGDPRLAASTGPVEMRLLLQPDHAVQAERYFGAARAGIAGYGLRLGPYPYSTLTLVDPPLDGLGSGGMEYPTFITLFTLPFLSQPPFDRFRLPEVVTVHELGHQYFYGLLASNEFEESWLDEGINSYYEMVVMDDAYGYPLEFLGLRLSALEQNRRSIVGGGYADPILTPSWGFASGGSYGQQSYPRPALTLAHLRHLLGPEVFARAMRAYAERFRWRHPTSEDFFATVEEVSGRELGWFFDQAFRSTAELDYAVRRVTTRRSRERSGVFWRDGEREEVSPEEDGEEGEGGEPRGWTSTVVVERQGEFRHPVEVEMRFANGDAVRRTWDGEGKWKRWRTRGSRLVAVEVDPDGELVLDTDRLDNGYLARPDPTPRRKLLADLLFFVQTFFTAAAELLA